MNKKIIYLVIILSIFASCSKTSKDIVPEDIVSKENLDGFLDIKWGDSLTDAIEVLKNNNINISVFDNTNILHIYDAYDGFKAEGEFLGYNSDLWVNFLENKFYRVSVCYYDKKNKYEYQEFINILTEKYGKPNTKKRYYPYNIWVFENNRYLVATLDTYITLMYYTNEYHLANDKN
jgi:hypothetical protein